MHWHLHFGFRFTQMRVWCTVAIDAKKIDAYHSELDHQPNIRSVSTKLGQFIAPSKLSKSVWSTVCLPRSHFAFYLASVCFGHLSHWLIIVLLSKKNCLRTRFDMSNVNRKINTWNHQISMCTVNVVDQKIAHQTFVNSTCKICVHNKNYIVNIVYVQVDSIIIHFKVWCARKQNTIS